MLVVPTISKSNSKDSVRLIGSYNSSSISRGTNSTLVLVLTEPLK